MKQIMSMLTLGLVLLTTACTISRLPPPTAQPPNAQPILEADDTLLVATEEPTAERAVENATLLATPTITEAIALEAAPEVAAVEESAITPRILVPTATPNRVDAPVAPLVMPPAVPPAVPPDDEVSARLQVPPGFAVRRFAEGLSKPRLMTFGPDNVLYVADQTAGEVLRLPDLDNDGVADEVQMIADGLVGAHGVEWFDGWLYVASYGEINRLQDRDNDGIFETQELVTDNIPGRSGHNTRTIHFGPDGMLYVAAGSTSNNAPESDPRRATILRFNPDGTIPADNPFANDEDERRHVVWAEGLRNSVDFLFLPDGRLWADHNGSDMLGDELPPEEIVIEIERGGHYGWPYCYTPLIGGNGENGVGGSGVGVIGADILEVRDERVTLDPDVLVGCADAIPARFTDLAHSAPLGMVQYNAPNVVGAFPAEYQGNLFVAYHGSWNSTDRRDCRVQMIVVADGQPVASQPFLTGFRESDEQQCNNAWGRPAGVAVGPDGVLYVSDDQNGQIYRVIYVGEK